MSAIPCQISDEYAEVIMQKRMNEKKDDKRKTKKNKKDDSYMKIVVRGEMPRES